MADTIDLSPEDRARPITDNQSDYESEDSSMSDNNFENAQQTPDLPLRRSTRNRRPPGTWCIGDNALSKALVAHEVTMSCKTASTPEDIAFGQPGIGGEHDCFNRNKTWELVDFSRDMKVLSYKYVFKVKENKPKVRLVALGCRQMHGVDYNEAFAPVVTMTTIRTVLAVTAHQDLELQQMDILAAFHNGRHLYGCTGGTADQCSIKQSLQVVQITVRPETVSSTVVLQDACVLDKNRFHY